MPLLPLRSLRRYRTTVTSTVLPFSKKKKRQMKSQMRECGRINIRKRETLALQTSFPSHRSHPKRRRIRSPLWLRKTDKEVLTALMSIKLQLEQKAINRSQRESQNRLRLLHPRWSSEKTGHKNLSWKNQKRKSHHWGPTMLLSPWSPLLPSKRSKIPYMPPKGWASNSRTGKIITMMEVIHPPMPKRSLNLSP